MDWVPFAKEVAQCHLFAGIPAEEVPGLLKKHNARLERYGDGKLVRLQGDLYDELIIVARGELEARIDDSGGKGLTVEHLRAPAPAATAIIASSDPILPVSLYARGETWVFCIPAPQVFQMLAGQPEILRAFLADAGDKVRFLAEKLRLFRFGSLRKKIAGHLLALSREQRTDSPRWRYGREETADLFGVARPSLSRELSVMASEGLLEPEGRKHVKIDRKALRSLLEED